MFETIVSQIRINKIKIFGILKPIFENTLKKKQVYILNTKRAIVKSIIFVFRSFSLSIYSKLN